MSLFTRTFLSIIKNLSRHRKRNVQRSQHSQSHRHHHHHYRRRRRQYRHNRRQRRRTRRHSYVQSRHQRRHYSNRHDYDDDSQTYGYHRNYMIERKALTERIPRPRFYPQPDAFTIEILDLTNQYRSSRHRLTLSRRLTSVARSHTLDQAFHLRHISHTGSDGSSLGQRVSRGGYRYKTVAENVASGQKNPKHVMKSWMKSSGHRRNILRSDVNEMAVWFTTGENGKVFWTQLFGKHL